ncbi:MAG: ribonuclease R [Bacteroidota bacterium]
MSKKIFGKRNPSSSSSQESVSQSIIAVFSKNQGAVLSHKQLCYLLNANKPIDRQRILDAVQRMVAKNRLEQVNAHSFALKQGRILEGFFELNAKGFGFIRQEGQNNDVLIREENKGVGMDGDRVQFTLINERNGKKEGRIISVIERARLQMVGTLKIKNDKALLYPDSVKYGVPVEIPLAQLNGAKNGMRIVAKITAWPNDHSTPHGEVVATLGFPGSNDSEMISILVNQGFDPYFPEEVMKEASLISTEITEEEILRRRDMREVLTFTIDPVDAKDFDDAISYLELDNGNVSIGVHIADVGHYIKEGSPLDKEALKRSNSVYLVDRVMPMLPEQLSNVLCSLRPNEDKLAFSVVFEFSPQGEIQEHWFGKTVIHSNRRFAYEEVQEIIEGKEDLLSPIIHRVNSFAKKMRAKRFKDGALNIISEELRFVLSDNGSPMATVLKTSKEAHQLIEEFMLLANKTIAMELTPHKEKGETHTSIYRIHDLPDPEKLSLLHMFCEKFGLELEIGDLNHSAQSINALLKSIETEPYYPLIQSMVVRSMAKAVYSTQNIGHFGLAFKFYTHFTSPIRRYADLIVHRQLFEKKQFGKIKMLANLEEICKKISANERKATEAERESTKYFQTLMLIDRIGDEFDGLVSGISDYGIFVRLLENHCEGMVPLQSISFDRFSFDADKHQVVGKKTGKSYTLGTQVRVRVEEVNPRKRQIDLILIED